MKQQAQQSSGCKLSEYGRLIEVNRQPSADHPGCNQCAKSEKDSAWLHCYPRVTARGRIFGIQDLNSISR